MTQSELSDKFDVLLASYEGGIELDEYEKSVFFNKAHIDLVKEYYLGINLTGKAYDATEELKRYLSKYLKKSTSKTVKEGDNPILIPNDCMFITLEYIDNTTSKKRIPVIPITHDDYLKTYNNPFRNHTTKRRALRIEDINTTNNINIISPLQGTYICTYISTPSDMDFVNNGNNEVNIHPSFLEIILQRAVELAAQSRGTIKKSNV